MIALVRVDNRLVHGQILEAWLPRLDARRVVVADDEAAKNALARSAMALCLPPDLPADVVRVTDADWDELAARKERILVLVRDVKDLARAAATGLTPRHAPKVNVGNVHFAAGRKPVSQSVFPSDDEVEALRMLVGEGFLIEFRAIPSDSPLDAEQIAERHRTAR